MDQRALEWIERYSAEVARLLPAAQRNDIKLEIRSLLMDEAEARAAGSAVTEAEVLTLLEQYPAPEQMAARYGAPSYLIGPALYPTYLTILRLVTTIITVLIVAMILLKVFIGHGAPSLPGIVFDLLQPILIATGIVTLVFALIERDDSARQGGAAVAAKGWKVTSLPPADPHGQVKLGDLYSSIIGTLVAIVWLNAFVGADGVLQILADGPTQIALFSQRFVSFIPWLSLVWGGELIIALVVLARRRWEPLTRLLTALLGGVAAILLSVMLRGGALAAQPSFESVVDGVVAAILLITLFEGAGHLRALYRERGSRARPLVPASPTG